MSPVEGLLIVIVLILIVAVMNARAENGAPRTNKTYDCVDRDSGAVTSVRIAKQAEKSPEQVTTGENVEHFDGCRDTSEHTQKMMSCMCEGEEDFAYANNEFGAPGMTYTDYVATNSVDAAVFRNHAEFVKDRLKTKGTNLIGATYSPDSHTSDQISWIGLRRPQAVKICNPTQVPDVNLDWYDKKPKLTWDSSTTSTVQ